MKAVIRFVFPPEPRKWLFSVSVPGGLAVQKHVAVTETTDARSKLAGVPVANIALPWEPSPGMCAMRATGIAISLDSTVAEPCLGRHTGHTIDWSKCNELVSFPSAKEYWLLTSVSAFTSRFRMGPRWSPTGTVLWKQQGRLYPLRLGYTLSICLPRVLGEILFNPNSYWLTSHVLSSLMDRMVGE